MSRSRPIATWSCHRRLRYEWQWSRRPPWAGSAGWATRGQSSACTHLVRRVPDTSCGGTSGSQRKPWPGPCEKSWPAGGETGRQPVPSRDRIAGMSNHAEGPRLGITVSPHIPAGDFVAYVRRIEELGFHEVWIVEDCFLHGAFAQAASVLAATSSLRVGLGIIPAAARNV